jgi:hypothetical protein
MKSSLKWGLLVLLVLLAWFSWPEKSSQDVSPNETTVAVKSSFVKTRTHQRATRQFSDDVATAQGLPRGTYAYIYDKSPGSNRFLIAKGRDDKFLSDSDAPSGMDLWLQDESGNERLLASSVYRAKFSPDGNKIAYTTSDCVMHVQDLNGSNIAEVAGVYGQSWKPDGKEVIFAKVGEGKDPHRPGTRQLTSLDVTTGKLKTLTDGKFDDGRPDYHPASGSVIFVSGGRTGLASFWQVPANGGEPIQLTNVGQREVTDQFVPPPYDKTLWSADKRWFIYDFKSGDQQETWGLEFDNGGKLKQAAKLADGINPRLQNDGQTLICERHVDGAVETIVSNLP